MTSTTKVRRWLSALCIVLLVPGPLTTSFLSARQGCADCTAVSLGNGWRVDNMGTGAEVGVCFGGGFSAHELSGFKAGFDYWTTYFATNSQFPKRDFNYTNPGSCNITVVKYGGLPSSTVANAAGKSDGSPAVIHINENRLVSSNGWQSTNYWGWAMAEEVGHLQDFDHFSGNCSGKTVMCA